MTTSPETARRRRAPLHSWWRSRRPGRGDEGSVSVELTLILVPVFVVLMLFVVLCARSASAAIDVNSAASAAARAASLAPSPAAARSAALDTATAALAGQSVTCGGLSVPVDTSQFHRGGMVAVTVHCRVMLSDLGLPGVGGSRDVSATARSPIDVLRTVTP